MLQVIRPRGVLVCVLRLFLRHHETLLAQTLCRGNVWLRDLAKGFAIATIHPTTH